MSHLPRVPHHWTPLHRNTPFSDKLTRWEPREQVYHDEARNVRMRWSSRAHRKGIPAKPDQEEDKLQEEKGLPAHERWSVSHTKVRWWGCDWVDISWWIAALFTLGSVWWCINAILVFPYFTRTSLGFTNTEAATAFLGGTTFLIGSYLGWVESLNPARDADFAWEVEEDTKTLIEPKRPDRSLGAKRKHFGSHPPLPTSTASPPTSSSHLRSPSTSRPASPTSTSRSDSPKWRWYGYERSVGYVANTIQLFGAVAFQISVVCGLPGVLPASGTEEGAEQVGRSEGLWLGLYWGMQILGAPCFAISGALFCYEVQKKWWLPRPLNIGWQIGFWNFWGGMGFWLCGIFGVWRQTSLSNPEIYQKWGTSFSTFLGSWFFLIGSYIQLWETLNKRSGL